MTKRRKTPEELRSQRWFAAPGRAGPHKYWRMAQAGFTAEDHHRKPVIGIINPWSDFNTCHAHFPQRVQDAKRGVWQAGGFPVEIPAHSVSESYVRPSSFLYRNFLAMEVEENIRAQPVDGVVIMGGCDKTTPAVIMAAASADVPAIYVPAGAMLRGVARGEKLGTGSSGWKADADYRADKINEAQWHELGRGTVRSAGTCNTMGTASTMMSLADVLGLSLPGASSIPAVDAAHPRMCSLSGRRIVELVWEDLKPRDIVTPAALRNAVVADMALSGSTNSLIHLVAMAGRLGRELSLDDFAAASESVPVLANLMPSGKYLMEDFYEAGGILALLNRIGDHLDLSCLTVNGKTLGENIKGAEVFDDDVIRPLDNPLYGAGGLIVLRGNLAPRGAVLKRSAAEPKLLQHTGAAVVFKNFQDLQARIDDPQLPVTPESVLVLQIPAPWAHPACPNGECCRCRKSCCSRACATWSASRTPA